MSCYLAKFTQDINLRCEDEAYAEYIIDEMFKHVCHRYWVSFQPFPCDPRIPHTGTSRLTPIENTTCFHAHVGGEVYIEGDDVHNQMRDLFAGFNWTRINWTVDPYPCMSLPRTEEG